MRVHILGGRGSTAAPGALFSKYGGHTSCVAIAHDGAVPSLVLDAGTGIRTLSELLGDAPFLGSVLLGHLHWDHTQGLPFFRSGDHPGARVDLYGPPQDGPGGLEEVLARAMSPPHFPISPGQLRGQWAFRTIGEGEHTVEGFTVTAREVPHKGGRTFGYRVSDGKKTLTYISDHCPTALGPGTDGLGEVHPAALALAANADLVLHDSQYRDDELPVRAHFGHSCPGYAVGLCRAAGARRLVLFHHDPWRTDAEIDAITARYQPGRPGEGGAWPGAEVGAAVEGAVIDLV